MAKINVQKRSAKENKADIQRFTGWDTAQYNKEYDKFRNRVRAYEKLTGTKTKESPAFLFHDYAYKMKHGQRQTGKMLAILHTPSYSSGKNIAAASTDIAKDILTPEAGQYATAEMLKKPVATALIPYAGLARRSPEKVKAIIANSENINEIITKLNDYANKIHEKQRKSTGGAGGAGGGADAFPADFYED